MGWTRRQLLAGAAGAALSARFPGPARAAARTLDGPAFGTYWRAVLPPYADAQRACSAIVAVVGSVDRALSPFRPSSEISRLNASDATDWWALSPDAAAVVGASLRIAGATGGAFDPTVGGIVNRYGFGPIRSDATATFADLAARPDAVRKMTAGVTCDPCGIAKGFALDRMSERLAECGIADHLIELGGEVGARGRHPGGRPWQVGIERPGETPTAFQRVVRLDGEALATSGDSVNGFDFAGRRYGHIIDPRTRRPAAAGLASVSVLAATGMVADALATALYAMGPEAGPDFADRRSIAALFLVRDGAGIREVQTGRFAAHIVA